MPNRPVSQKLGKGCIYLDKSSKGVSKRRNAWCVEIQFRNIRIRKRSAERESAEEWLEIFSEKFNRALLNLSDNANNDKIKALIRKVKSEILECS